MPLRQELSDAFHHIQGHLFPCLRAEVGPLTEDHERLVTVLGMVRIETFVQVVDGWPGRPPEDRPALARAFVAKAVFDKVAHSGCINAAPNIRYLQSPYALFNGDLLLAASDELAQLSASLAGTLRPVRMISIARPWPTSRGRRTEPPSSSGMPQRRQYTPK